MNYAKMVIRDELSKFAPNHTSFESIRLEIQRELDESFKNSNLDPEIFDSYKRQLDTIIVDLCVQVTVALTLLDKNLDNEDMKQDMLALLAIAHDVAKLFYTKWFSFTSENQYAKYVADYYNEVSYIDSVVKLVIDCAMYM